MGEWAATCHCGEYQLRWVNYENIFVNDEQKKTREKMQKKIPYFFNKNIYPFSILEKKNSEIVDRRKKKLELENEEVKVRCGYVYTYSERARTMNVRKTLNKRERAIYISAPRRTWKCNSDIFYLLDIEPNQTPSSICEPEYKCPLDLDHIITGLWN